MARLLAAVALLAPATGFVAPVAPASSSALRADASGMDGIQAPTGFFDPLGLSKSASDETLAWYRAAEIKHGRVAMAAFLGAPSTARPRVPGRHRRQRRLLRALGTTKPPSSGTPSRVRPHPAHHGHRRHGVGLQAQQPDYLRGGTRARSADRARAVARRPWATTP